MALRYLVPGGNGLSNSTTNWSGASGGSSGFSIPGSNDDIIIDINSLNAPLTFNAAMTVKSITVSDYTGTLTIDSSITLTIRGSAGTGTGFVQFNSTFTFTGDGTIRFESNNASVQCTLNTGSVVLDTIVYFYNITASQPANFILNSNIICGKSVYFEPRNTNGNDQLVFTGGFNIIALGDVYMLSTPFGATNRVVNLDSGVYLIINGTTPQNVYFDCPTNIGNVAVAFIIDCTSTVTFYGRQRYVANRTEQIFTYVAGTVIFDETHELYNSASTIISFNTNGTSMIFNRFVQVTTSVNQTITLYSDFYVKHLVGNSPTGGTPANITRTIESNIPATTRKFIVTHDGSQDCLFRWLSTDDIDSFGGQTIFSLNGTNAPSRNWKLLIDNGIVAGSKRSFIQY